MDPELPESPELPWQDQVVPWPSEAFRGQSLAGAGLDIRERLRSALLVRRVAEARPQGLLESAEHLHKYKLQRWLKRFAAVF